MNTRAAIALLLLVAAPAARADQASALRDAEAGFTLSRAGNWAEAAPALRQAFAADPGNLAVATELGFVLGRLGQLREAETTLRRAVALDPRNSYPYVTLAELLVNAPDRWQRREEIVAFFERGLAAMKDEPAGAAWVALRLATFERSVGLIPQAQRRLHALLAADVPATLRQQALALQGLLDADDRARRLEDWPDGPPLGEADRIAVKRAEAAVRAGQAERAIEALTPVLARVPESVEARWVRARALDRLGRYDHALEDLTILLQLKPSHAEGWRKRGMILAEHGGSLEAARADEALRHALALEPSWDDLRELRRRVAAKRGATGQPALPATSTPPPTPRAQELLAEAQRWRKDEAPEFAEARLQQALAESPGYVEAAVTLFALTGVVPEATLRALWEDAPALERLAAAIKDVGKDRRPSPVVGRCLDRAIELGSTEARWRRAELRAAAGDRAGALADLTDYVAREAEPRHLDEARALRATLVPTETSGPTERQAFLALVADRAPEAERLLGGPCRAGLPSARLVELGRVHEYAGASAPAIACYRLAVEAAAPGRTLRAAQARLAAAAARAPLALVEAAEAPLRAARRAQVPAAAWALARLEHQRQRPDEARVHVEAFLAAAAPDDPSLPEATKLHGDLTERDHTAATRRLGLAGAVAAGLLGAGLLAFARRFRGVTVPRALARRPALFPELSRAVAEVRHDVIKHRASVLGLGDDEGAREDMARVLLEPRPASELVGEIYTRVEQAAAGLGLTLRPLDREPTFGPIADELRKAETILRSGAPVPLAEIDRVLREEHAPRLGQLLTLGPRTQLDAERLTRWIRAVEAEGPVVTSPGLLLRQIDLSVGVEEDALFTIFSNLLRNAAEAVAERPEPRILVRVDRETDVTGRQLVTILVADSAPHALLLADIEARDGQRGLGLVRDLTRKWGGHLAIRNEAAPLVKAIGVSFPAGTEAVAA